MTLFKGTPQNRGRCIQDTVEIQQNDQMAYSATFSRPKKDKGNKILQTGCSSEENRTRKTPLK